MRQQEFVVLVDKYGDDLFNANGRFCLVEKIEAHRRGLLHRAVSVFVFNNRNELLLQKRADRKYHCRKKWSNTCCTHPLPGETPLVAAQRRLIEEMGLLATLTEAFTFSYQADVGNGLIENEFDHVFFGVSDQSPSPNPAEVSDWKWVTVEELERELIRNPKEYSPWLRECFHKVINHKCKNQDGPQVLRKW
jgi:isopentenyl-diphosphate delta-isomerase